MEETNLKERITELETRLREQEKLASLGMLSAGIAHEIQNPLNFVINFSKLSVRLLADLGALLDQSAVRGTITDRQEIDDLRLGLLENMEKIRQHGDRAISIIRGILLYSRGREGEAVLTPVQQLTREYVWLAYHAMRANYKNFNIIIHEDYTADLPPVRLIPQDYSRAVLNIMNNACYAVWKKWQTGTAGYVPEITVTLVRQEEEFILSVRDNGVGMTPEVKQRLFDAFFTTKPAGQGTGLGMGIVRDIIERRHHGKIRFDSVENEYTCFEFILPVL